MKESPLVENYQGRQQRRNKSREVKKGTLDLVQQVELHHWRMMWLTHYILVLIWKTFINKSALWNCQECIEACAVGTQIKIIIPRTCNVPHSPHLKSLGWARSGSRGCILVIDLKIESEVAEMIPTSHPHLYPGIVKIGFDHCSSCFKQNAVHCIVYLVTKKKILKCFLPLMLDHNTCLRL